MIRYCVKDNIFILLILFFSILLSLSFFLGISNPDGFAYCQIADNFNKGIFDITRETSVYSFRYPLWFPIAIFFRIFGVTDLSASLWPILCSVGSVILIYLLGKLLFDKATGLLGALLLSFFPISLATATEPVPDHLIQLLTATAIYLFLRIEKKKTGLIPYFLIGLLIGIASLAREIAILTLVFFLVYILFISRLNYKRIYILICIFFGVIAVFLLEIIFYYFMVGNPFLRFHILSKIVRLYRELPGTFHFSLLYYPKTLLGLTREGLANFSFFFHLFGFSLLFCFMTKKSRQIIIPLLWLLPLFLYLEFGMMDLGYLKIIKEPRYLLLVSIPWILILAFSIRKWTFNSKFRLRLSVIALSMLFITSVYGAYRVRKNFFIDIQPYQIAYQFLKKLPAKNIYYTGIQWPLYLNFYFKYTKGYIGYGREVEDKHLQFKDLYNFKKADQIHDAYIIIHDRYVYYDFFGNPVKSEDVPEFIQNPPCNWQLALEYKSPKVWQRLLKEKAEGMRIYFSPP